MADPDLSPLAIAIGHVWATELVDSLRSADREIIGAWPGTLREARSRVRVAVRARLELEDLDRLAHLAYVAARRDWQAICQPDPEV